MAAPSPFAALRAALGRLLGALPFVKRALPPSPEPFSSIEDATPNEDVLFSANAAPGLAASKRARIDFKSAVEAASHKTGLLIGLAAALGFLLVLAVTAILVSAPPPAPPRAPTLDKEGEALVRSWLVPPGSALEPRMEMERESIPGYSAADAFRLGLDPAKADLSKSEAANDAAAEELFRTVR